MIEAGSCRGVCVKRRGVSQNGAVGTRPTWTRNSLERESGARTSQTPYNARTCSTGHRGLLRPRGVDHWSYSVPARGMRMVVDERDHAIVAFDQRCAALNPITAIVIRDRTEFADG